jgi:Transglutaminase-like superfamily/TgpA N-terminal domain
MNGVLRFRVGIVTVMMLIVALAAGDIFSQTIPWLAIVPVAVGAWAMINRRWPIRVVLSAVTIIVATSTIVLTAGGRMGDLAKALTGGPQRLLTTDWPSPALPDLLGTVGGALGLATAFAVFAARRSDLHLTPLVPVVVAYTAVIALSAPLGVRPMWILPLGVLSLILAAFRPDAEVRFRDRIMLLRGERRLLSVAVVAVGLAALLAVPLVLTGRADPRRNEPATRSAALLDPIEATLALQAIDPPISLHEITLSDDESASRTPLNWRTAALGTYDGQRWESDVTLRPIGRRLGVESSDMIDASVRFFESDQQLVPLPGQPVAVDAAIETDSGRNIVRLIERPSPGDIVNITTTLEPGRVSVDPGRIGTRELDENASGLTQLATGLAEAGGAGESSSLLEQLEAIESTMHDNFALQSDAIGGGLQRALIDRFVRDTQRGNAEQFSTAFVLLARSLGVDARVATGFQADPTQISVENGVTTISMSSADAAIWPEIRIGEGWVVFDPVPAEEASDANPPPPEPQAQAPSAAQPPIVPPPESADEPVVTQEDNADETRASLPVVVTILLRTAAVVGVLLVPVFLGVLAILGTKWRRRRRLLRGAAVDRIRGAWALATCHLVDAGMSIAPSRTNYEIADDGENHVPSARRELHRMASLASATTFGAPARPDLLAEDAAFCLGNVETSIAGSRTRWQRIRWQLSLRSLRRRTSSPVELGTSRQARRPDGRDVPTLASERSLEIGRAEQPVIERGQSA